tara:strand:+ start:236 stop:403 length:168 start_codon:yes stop_codon:yes gene_type:complete
MPSTDIVAIVPNTAKNERPDVKDRSYCSNGHHTRSPLGAPANWQSMYKDMYEDYV